MSKVSINKEIGMKSVDRCLAPSGCTDFYSYVNAVTLQPCYALVWIEISAVTLASNRGQPTYADSDTRRTGK